MKTLNILSLLFLLLFLIASCKIIPSNDEDDQVKETPATSTTANNETSPTTIPTENQLLNETEVVNPCAGNDIADIFDKFVAKEPFAYFSADFRDCALDLECYPRLRFALTEYALNRIKAYSRDYTGLEIGKIYECQFTVVFLSAGMIEPLREGYFTAKGANINEPLYNVCTQLSNGGDPLTSMTYHYYRIDDNVLKIKWFGGEETTDSSYNGMTLDKDCR